MHPAGDEMHPAGDEMHPAGDDIPLLSQWIKKSKPIGLDFLGE